MKAITALGVGTFIGAAIAILFAPKSGEATLADLTDRVNDSIERGTAKVREIARQTTKLKDQVQDVRGAVNAGVRAFKEARKQGWRLAVPRATVSDSSGRE
jgi:gas vesicle protein